MTNSFQHCFDLYILKDNGQLHQLTMTTRQLVRSDAHFLNNCSFLTKRFRPGTEIASVFFLLRCSFFVLEPTVL